MKWKIHPKQSVSLGYGLHSQLQPIYIYTVKTEIGYNSSGQRLYKETNNNLRFTKSNQFVAGYD